MRDDVRDLPRFPPVVAAIVLGALWGGLAYATLWGHTPIVMSRRFVVSPVGTLVLLPVRLVLWAIHAAEGVLGETLVLADGNWWIGPLAGALGALIAIAGLLLARAAKRDMHRSA